MNGSALQSPPRLRLEQLLIRSTALRLQLAQQVQMLAGPLTIADSLCSGLHWLRRHPEWPLGGLALLALLRPRRAWRWASRVWWGWRLWRRGSRWLAAARDRVPARR